MPATRLTLSPTATITVDVAARPPRPAPIPAAAEIMVESDQLTAAEIVALADATQTIRGVDVAFGAHLGTDALGDLGLRVFFAGPVDDGIGCGSFDLVDPAVAPPRPTAALGSPAAQGTAPIEIALGASVELRWAVARADTKRLTSRPADATGHGARTTEIDLPDVADSGTVTVSPTVDTIYELTAVSAGGTASATLRINVTA